MSDQPSASTEGVRRALTGWGRAIHSVADVHRAETPEAVTEAVAHAGPRGVLARGLGRSYGDAALNAGGCVVELVEGPGALVDLDPRAGVVTAWGGVGLDTLLRVIVPKGWFVPVTPGTRFVTVGGAIAADIHGKNHHVEGSLANHVTSLSLLGADGTVRGVGPDRDPAAFWATVGGMGLTGIVLDATFRLLPIETSTMLVDTERADDLDDLLARMEAGDAAYRYSVAWVDLTARGRHLGRSVLTRGDHAPRAALPDGAAADPLRYDPKVLLTAPPVAPPGLLNALSVRAFNEAWFRKAPRRQHGGLHSISGFFHPLDGVRGWNALYGPAGFVQYQFVVPFGAEGVLRTVVERLAEAGAPSFLTVLKRFGPGNPAPLSFPREGWTLALDLAASRRGLGDLLHELDHLVLDAGGRHYFAKDAATTPEAIRRGYPRLDEWRAERDRLDPGGRWCSDLGRRLGLVA